MLAFIQNWLVNQGVAEAVAMPLGRGIAVILVIILSVVAYFVTKRLILSALTYSAGRTKTRWDDIPIRRGVLNRLAFFAPALVVYLMTPMVLAGYDQLTEVIRNIMLVCIVIIGVLVVDALLSAVSDIYRTFDFSKEIPIRGPIQVARIVAYFFGGILIVAIVLDKTPVYLLTGLGALSAVLMFVFKDPILGFVAGIQLTANKMVAPGDQIEMPKYNASGSVLEIGLTTVKVQNSDKTITTIPTYALISESFKNWRGMQEAGGRRIQRCVYIDISTIKFCTEEMLDRFARIQFTSDYVERKRVEISASNATPQIDDSSLVNGRDLTNIGIFRAYVTAYLENHPMINREMAFLVRPLAPTIHGLPIEIYVFSKDKVWANYEGIQAEIFDHILAVVPEFDLKVFQVPAGSDLKSLADLNQ